MADSNSTQMAQVEISRRIDAQRTVIFRAMAILGCLGEALQNVEVPHGATRYPDLQHVTDALVEMLESAATSLEPTVLGLPASTTTNLRGGDQ